MSFDDFLELVCSSANVKTKVGNDNLKIPVKSNYFVLPYKQQIEPHVLYHDEEHCSDVAMIALYLYYNECIYEDEKLDVSIGVCILLAGLYHDAYHSGGLEPDSVNVKKSIEIFKSMYSGYNVNVIDAILDTEYPNTKAKSSSIISKCICDADMLYTILRKDGDKIVLFKLMPEMLIGGSSFKYKDLIEVQTNFTNSISPRTLTGVLLYSMYKIGFLVSFKKYKFG